MTLIYKKVLLTLMVASLTACMTSPKSESKSQERMEDGVIYKGYSKLSKEAMKPVVKELNKELAKDNKDQNADYQVHALLSLIWIASLQPKLAMAEADYAIEHTSDPRDQYAAMMLQSIAMYEEGWPHLAKQKSDQARTLSESENFKNRYNNATTLVYLVGGVLAFKEGNITYLASEVKHVGKALDRNWITELGEVTDDVKNGLRDNALIKMVKLMQDPTISANARASLQQLYEGLKQASVFGEAFVKGFAQSVLTLVLYVAIQINPLSIAIIHALPEKYRDKLAELLK